MKKLSTCFKWSGLRGSNPRPPRWQRGDAIFRLSPISLVKSIFATGIRPLSRLRTIVSRCVHEHKFGLFRQVGCGKSVGFLSPNAGHVCLCPDCIRDWIGEGV